MGIFPMSVGRTYIEKEFLSKKISKSQRIIFQGPHPALLFLRHNADIRYLKFTCTSRRLNADFITGTFPDQRLSYR